MQILHVEQMSQFFRHLWFCFLFLGMILRFCWRGLSPALLGTHLSERTRVGRVPTSYPTASTRRLMRPAANARTDPKVYVDCHGDYRISATIYTNRLSKSRDILTLFFYKKWTTGLVFPSNFHAGLDLLTPFSLSSPRRRGSPSRIFIYISH